MTCGVTLAEAGDFVSSSKYRDGFIGCWIKRFDGAASFSKRCIIGSGLMTGVLMIAL